MGGDGGVCGVLLWSGDWSVPGARWAGVRWVSVLLCGVSVGECVICGRQVDVRLC